MNYQWHAMRLMLWLKQIEQKNALKRDQEQNLKTDDFNIRTDREALCLCHFIQTFKNLY